MNTLNITQVRTGGPFLQIYGHQDAQLLDKLSVNINACLPYLQKTIVPVQQLKLKTIYLVKTNQYQYHRCILAKPKKITNNIVSVELIDYGIEIEVPAENVSSQKKKKNLFKYESAFFFVFEFDFCY